MASRYGSVPSMVLVSKFKLNKERQFTSANKCRQFAPHILKQNVCLHRTLPAILRAAEFERRLAWRS